MALDGQRLRRSTSGQTVVSGQIGVIDGPVDDLVQLGAAVDAGDGHLVLQGQIALVHHTQLRQLIGAARLPQNGFVFSASGLLEFQLPALCIGPAGDVAILVPCSGVLELNIQIAGLDLVDAGGCGVGEPCKGSAYQHGQAQNHGHDAAQQGPFGALAVCHNICLLFFACAGLGRWAFAETAAKGNTDRHIGAAPLLRMTPSLTPPYRFSETIDAHGRPGAHFYAGILPLIWTQCKSLFVKNYHFFWNFLYPTPRHDKRALLLAARPLFFRELRCHYRSCAVNTISPG